MFKTKEERLKRGREYKRKKYYTDSVYREKRLKESELIHTQNHNAEHLSPRTIPMQRLFQ